MPKCRGDTPYASRKTSPLKMYVLPILRTGTTAPPLSKICNCCGRQRRNLSEPNEQKPLCRFIPCRCPGRVDEPHIVAQSINRFAILFVQFKIKNIEIRLGVFLGGGFWYCYHIFLFD